MRYHVLGPLEVLDATGAPRPIRRGRPRTLLHLLLVHRRVVVPVETVADRLWGEEQPVNAGNAVHQLVSYLRRVLDADKQDLVTSAVGYQLDADDDDVDAFRFLGLLQETHAALAAPTYDAAQRALAAAETAATLWRGEPFAESDEHEWIAGDVARLKEAYLAVQESRMEAMLRLGRHREVVLEAQSLASAYPFREQFHAHTALALYRSDRQTEALEELRAVRERLDQELGLDPGAQLRDLEQAILRQDPQLDWVPRQEQVAVVESRALEAVPESPARPEQDPSPPPSVLPPRSGRLIGRDQDLTRLRADLAEPGATVAVTGLPGVGKTAVARQLAHELADDGTAVWWVDLRGVDHDELVSAAVTQQTVPTSTPAPGPGPAQAFRGADGLLVLDGCEQVLGGATAFVDAVRPGAPGLRFLLTTRRSTAPETAVRRQLGPLAASDDAAHPSPAVELFADRARRVCSEFAVTDDNRDDIATVVAAVGGLPLGIELAAVQADVMSIADIAAELGAGADQPPGAAPGPDDTLGPLGAAIGVSVRQLEPDERAAFAAWGVLAGSFTAEDAAALGDLEARTARRLLASLVRQSLVDHDGGSTYRMLRPVQAVARSVLDEREAAEVRRRHAERVAAMVSLAAHDLRTTTDALARLSRYEADARAALDWSLRSDRLDLACDIAVSYTWHWAISGHTDEGLAWLRRVEQVLTAAGDPQREAVPPARRGAVLRCIGLLANPLGEVAEARAACRAAIELLEEGGDELGAIDALLTLGISEWALGDLEAAAAAHEAALARAEPMDEPFRVLTATVLLARTALDAAAPDAPERIRVAVEMGQAQGEKQLLSIALGLMARSHLAAGRGGEARLAAEQALTEARSIGYREGEMGALNLLARAALVGGDAERAQSLLGRALRLAVDARHISATCETLESLALVAAGTGGHEHAYLLVRAAAVERARRGLAPVGPGHDAVEEVAAGAVAVLGEDATAMVEARLAVRRFDELVADVLAGLTDA